MDQMVDDAPDDSIVGVESPAHRIGRGIHEFCEQDLVVKIAHVPRPHLCLREVPLSDHAGFVSTIAEHFGNRHTVGLEEAAIAGPILLEGHFADTGLMGIQAGQQ